ncbi:hypothetical protein LOC68_05405 [Blastopirellula sp. JC732]|uniref:Uncharacterized protein n=1 Tax=Blastopirellula sediminis TaxID=2894196 RepID=A0A9X1SI71_9BACT|nr:hypothetical protein [Blastopirellula sediminis]MCC9609399.1 hypothetical protein [Blastopirellula sediminis]MCC9627824.1 hypothetical protein [Blastopirellula sediminis]
MRTENDQEFQAVGERYKEDLWYELTYSRNNLNYQGGFAEGFFIDGAWGNVTGLIELGKMAYTANQWFAHQVGNLFLVGRVALLADLFLRVPLSSATVLFNQFARWGRHRKTFRQLLSSHSFDFRSTMQCCADLKLYR